MNNHVYGVPSFIQQASIPLKGALQFKMNIINYEFPERQVTNLDGDP